MTMSMETAAQWRGADVLDQDGDKVGKVEEIYLDQQTDQPEWALVKTGLFGSKSTFVPLTGANEDGDKLRVPFEKSQIKDAPKIDAEQELSQEEERELYSHYGMDYSQSQSETGLPAGGAATGGTGETPGTAGTADSPAVERGDETTDRGGVRLKKYVVTEEVRVEPDNRGDTAR